MNGNHEPNLGCARSDCHYFDSMSQVCTRQHSPIPNQKCTIWYAGELCFYGGEFVDVDGAQAAIDLWRKQGYQACCLHEGGRHQLYVSETRRSK
jgi:hypothetical protein